LIKNDFICEPKGSIIVKGKGVMPSGTFSLRRNRFQWDFDPSKKSMLDPPVKTGRAVPLVAEFRDEDGPKRDGKPHGLQTPAQTTAFVMAPGIGTILI